MMEGEGTRTIRGIVNTTTACHVASSLVLLCHCLPPIREALLRERATTARGSRVRREMSRFLREYYLFERQEEDGEHPQQEELHQQKAMKIPNKLYEALLSETGIHAEDVGDVVTTLAKMLDHLRRCDEWPPVSKIVRYSLDGWCHRVIQNDRRRKVLPPRNLACPYPVRVAAVDDSTATPTLLEALRESLQPQELQGYQWTGDIEEVPPTKEPSRSTAVHSTVPSVTTTKTLIVDQAPPIWLIHLERTGVVGLPVEASSQDAPRVDIPVVLDASSVGVNAEYRLVGGLVHISSETAIEDCSDAGHTVAVVQFEEDESHGEIKNHPNWYIVDDETATLVSTEASQDILSGCETERGTAGGVLVVYQQIGWDWKSLVDEAMAAEVPLDSGTEQSTSTRIDWTKPLLLVGRRVRVKWAKDMWYEGMVSHYDPATGQHSIAYDDGDIRSYRLEKKTIEWLG